MTTTREDIAVIKNDIISIKEDIRDIKDSMSGLMIKVYSGAGVLSVIISLVTFLLTK